MNMINLSAESDVSQVIDSVVLGFSADPIFRWLFPEPHNFLIHAPTLVRLFGGRAFENNSAYHLKNYTGAALWLRPGIHPDEVGITKLVQDNIDGPQLEEVLSMFEQMDSFHPNEPCWHLALISVDPAHQNNGYGTALMKHTLEVVDNEKKLAYLESTNEANLSLYQRHGFELIGNIQAGNSLSLFPMIREPQ
jgi:ribosomal protein S18 acetylase RimI-like enzyme